MFTGIVRKTAEVKSFAPSAAADGARLEVFNPGFRAAVGDSVAVNGVCSTVVKTGAVLGFQYMPETLARSAIGKLEAGETVNLEECLRVSDRLDGHIVLGHVDTVGKISVIKNESHSKVLTIEPREPKRFMKFIVEKGSIAVDGVSLTIISVSAKNFVVKLIPYTLAHTTLGEKRLHSAINLEFDILAKYLEKLCG